MSKCENFFRHGLTLVLLAAIICSPSVLAAEKCARSFSRVVEMHTGAVENRDLETYIATIAPRAEQMMILPDGSYLKSLEQINEWHQAWFADSSWVFNTTLVRKDERTNWGLVVYKVTVDRADKPGSPFLLSMLFAPEQDGCWYLQHDQNTVIKTQ